MVMAQGYTKEAVISILENVEGSILIDNKTKAILRYAEKVTRNAYDVTESDIQILRQSDCSDEEILEATFIIAYYNAINRIADALGAPIENLVERFQNN
ncbi:MAG: carboxymuconolactone decarboxylase family protein [Deltaproteobacteria bacterium]|nr:carboxymuconolactone decarboxylase family protein [Deltaproteobacteria bacterium]